mmetsp:Transcript_5943/g.8026  ORF Transcript_5943/g.8026 Transcript_5943/m.8026 type:complete len:147 (-) Transcript_5943:57-497(-)|eukprot:CAMPEP_0196581620 /NCGR_PEP_ID=MMETSP1081-20130531/34618_1 /TAXON_ID=36882 /ORGANISM="Pyramimonas amylifera, Strain CCMP720" /LENGTH=146 /DNA_ID=CAMNT_0041901917 /DNA_START=32 /DNA_END=472 /DNA_ORIENTATION=+
MKTKILIAILILGLLQSQADKIYFDDSVMVLTGTTFDSAVSDYRFILVEFYAPWCGHCKSLAPEYELAAKHFKKRWKKGEFTEVAIAKVDATENMNKDLASRFGVTGYPSLKIFKDGEYFQDYNGGREWKDMASHMRMMSKEHAEL